MKIVYVPTTDKFIYLIGAYSQVYKQGCAVCEALVLIERNKRLTPKSLRHSETYDAIQVSFSNFYLALF